MAEAAMQTDLTEEDPRAVDMDIRRLASELRTLTKQKQQLEVTEASLREDNAKVIFYTGLGSFSVLFAVFQFVESVVKHCTKWLGEIAGIPRVFIEAQMELPCARSCSQVWRFRFNGKQNLRKVAARRILKTEVPDCVAV